MDNKIYSLEYLGFAHDQLSLEFLDLKGTLTTLPVRFSGFVNDMKNYTNDTLNKLTFSSHRLDTSYFEKIGKVIDYASLMKFEIYIPPGLKLDARVGGKVGGLLGYADSLELVNQHFIQRLISDCLKPAQDWLSQLMSDPENLSSVRDLKAQSGVRIGPIEEAKTIIGQHFKGDDMLDRAEFGKCFSRNADVVKTIELVNKLNQDLAGISRKEIMSYVETISDTVDRLVHHVDNAHPNYQPSAKVLKDISDTVYQVGEYVELFAAYSFKLMSFTQAMEDNRCRFVKVFLESE